MSTAMIWLLLFIVVALALLIAALTKTKFTVQKISIIGIMAALSFVAYEFFRIPNVLGTGSSFHLGNTFTALTALLLDGVSGGLAGAIGLALADILAGDPGYAVTTFILKFIIGLVCGGVAHRIIHLRSFPTGSKLKYIGAVTVSAFSGLLVNVFTDPFIGYFRNRYIFGQPAEFVSVVTKISSGVTLVILQEIVQQNPEEKLSYVVEQETGPDHNKHFVVAVRFNSDCVARGEGRSKKMAEQHAAREALKLLGVIKEK